MENPQQNPNETLIEASMGSVVANLASPETNQYIFHNVVLHKNNLANFKFEVKISHSSTLVFKLSESYIAQSNNILQIPRKLTDFFSGRGFDHVFRYWIEDSKDKVKDDKESRAPVFLGLVNALKQFTMFEEGKVYNVSGDGEGVTVYRPELG